MMHLLISVFFLPYLCRSVVQSQRTDEGLLLGSLQTYFYRIGGSIYALDSNLLYYSPFSISRGSPPILVVRYRVKGERTSTTAAKYVRERGKTPPDTWSLLSPTESLPLIPGREYDIVIPLKDNEGKAVEVTDLDRFDVYCALVGVVMAEVRGAEIFEKAGNLVEAGNAAEVIRGLESQREGESCPAEKEWSCYQLAPILNLHWKLESNGLVRFRLEGEVGEREYMAFGISGSDDDINMVGADVVVAYKDSDSTYKAVDYYISTRSQCNGEGVGACPDEKNDVRDVSGNTENNIVSISYSRLNVTTDEPSDKAFRTQGGKTQVLWAIGPLTSSTNFPLYHTRSFSSTETELDLCMVDTCAPLVGSDGGDDVKWEPSCIEKETDLRFEIGPSGKERGYVATTSSPSWGIAYWVNGDLIPYIVVERGQTYQIRSRTGKMHPVYISLNDKFGAYQTLVRESGTRDRSRIRILAGLDPCTGDSLASGDLDKYCEYIESESNSHKQHDTYESFKRSLTRTSNCSSDTGPGTWASFNWTVPSESSEVGDRADVYYQCAIHQNLGWRFVVVDNGTRRGLCRNITEMGLTKALDVLEGKTLAPNHQPVISNSSTNYYICSEPFLTTDSTGSTGSTGSQHRAVELEYVINLIILLIATYFL